jgi:hypothetical protein
MPELVGLPAPPVADTVVIDCVPDATLVVPPVPPDPELAPAVPPNPIVTFNVLLIVRPENI